MLWAGLLLSAVLALCFYDILFFDRTLKVSTANPQALTSGPYKQAGNRLDSFPVHSTTTPFMEEPMFEFVRRSLRDGIFPLWNPHQGCGYPLIAMMNLGLLWPLNFLFYILPNTWAWDAVTLLRLLLGGFFAFCFMRELRYRFLPALTTGVIFMLSSAMVLFQYAYANVEILTPLLLLFAERLIRRPDRRRAAFFSLAVALTFFAGHPEHIVIVNGAAALYLIFRCIVLRRSTRPPAVCAYAVGSYVLALGLSAIVFLPFLADWLRVFWHSHTETMGVSAAGSRHIHESLIGFVFPHFFQNVPVTLDFTRPSWWGYIGIIPLGLIVLSIFSRQRRGLNFFFLALFFLVFAKNHINHPAVNWIGYLPLVRHIRFDFHTPHIFGFFTALLAGMGMRTLLSRRLIDAKILLYSSLIIAAGIWAWLSYGNPYHQTAVPALTKSGIFLIILIIIILLYRYRVLSHRTAATALFFILTIEIFSYIPRDHARRFDSFPKTPYIEYIKNQPGPNRTYGVFWTLYPNTATAYRLNDLGINQGLLMDRLVRFTNAVLIPGHFNKERDTSAIHATPLTFMPSARPYLDMLNVRYTAAPYPTHPYLNRFNLSATGQPVYRKEAAVYAHTAFPRAYIVHRAIMTSSPEQSETLLQRSRGTLSDGVILEAAPDESLINRLAQTPLRDNSHATILSYTPNSLTISADMEHDGLLVLSDTYHPDWEATVDGRPARIYPANILTRAVFVPAGKHTVKMRFRPESFRLGIILSLFSFIVWSLLMRKKSISGKDGR